MKGHVRVVEKFVTAAARAGPCSGLTDLGVIQNPPLMTDKRLEQT